MARSFALVLTSLIALAPANACSKLTGGKAQPTDIPPPPTVTSATATTPPIWVPPPDTGGGGLATSAPPPSNPDLAKARAFASAGEWKKLKALLGPKVKAGKSSPEETQLLYQACTTTKDKPCLDALRKSHPELDM